LSLKGGFVALNSIKKVKDGNHRLQSPPVTSQTASHQPPAASCQPPSQTASSLYKPPTKIFFLTFNLCINRQLSLCYYQCVGKIRKKH